MNSGYGRKLSGGSDCPTAGQPPPHRVGSTERGPVRKLLCPPRGPVSQVQPRVPRPPSGGTVSPTLFTSWLTPREHSDGQASILSHLRC